MDIDYFLSTIRHNRIHLTPCCFLPVASIWRGICLFNGSRSIIHEVHNEIITKRLCSPLSLAPLKSFIVILRIFLMCMFIVLYQNSRFLFSQQFRTSASFLSHREDVFKECSISESIIVPTSYQVLQILLLKIYNPCCE
jgi:hypothetical protein